MDTSLAHFLKTGQLGPISLGMNPAEVQTILGPPKDRSQKLNPLILRYDALELTFWTQAKHLPPQLKQIALSFQPDIEPLPAPIAFTDWRPDAETTDELFMRFLAAIKLAPVQMIGGEQTMQFVMPSGVRVSFTERKLKSLQFSRQESKENRPLPLTDQREPSVVQIAQALNDARKAMDAGLERAAIVLAWAALEAALRRAALQAGLKGKIGTQPSALARQLSAVGLLNQRETAFLEETRQLRTEIVHGLAPKPVPQEIIRNVIAIADRFVRLSDSQSENKEETPPRPSRRIKVFLDESGHSGKDLYDPNQPIFVLCGVWLDETQEQEAIKTFAGLKKTVKVKDELKAKNLLKHGSGRTFMRKLCDAIRSAGVRQSLVVVHKPFFAAGVLVDDCTDYVFNPRFDERWTWDTRLKEPLAERILDAADPSLLLQAWHHRNGTDKQAFKAAYKRLLSTLTLHADNRLAKTADLMMSCNLDELWEAHEGARQAGWEYSPNLSAFNAMLQGLNRQAEQLGAKNIELIHDQQAQFAKVFQAIWQASTRAAQGELHYPSGNVLKYPTAHLAALTFTDSKSEIGIMLADILAGATRVLVQDCMAGKHDRSADYAPALSALLSVGAGIFPFAIGPERWQVSTLKCLLGHPL